MIFPRRLCFDRACLALGLALALATGAPAQDAPVDLHAPPPASKPAAPPPTPPTRPADLGKDAKPAKDAVEAKDAKPAADAKATPDAAKEDLTAAEVVAKANAYFEDARVMTADFVQIGPDGTRSEGQLYVQRPGRMLFRYNPPSPLEVVADGRSVAVRDQNLGTQDLYFIAQTPLKFLLADHIDLNRDTKVERVEIDDTTAMIEIEDKATFGGKSEITLVFDLATFALKQWTVLDAQGFQTVVTLFDIDLVSKPDPSLFHIDETFASTPKNKR